MKFDWSEEKNEILKRERGISFEDLINSEYVRRIKNKSCNHQNQEKLIML